MAIGIDIVEVKRIQQLAEEHPAFLTRVYTEHDINYCGRKKNRHQHFAARFAAKEAMLKALGVGWARDVRWTDIEVVNDALGRPSIKTYGEVKRLAEGMEVKENIRFSFPHHRLRRGFRTACERITP